MGQFEDIVIVGGGPAGAYCAFELAKQGIKSTIFDHSHPREKPCGGGISPLLVDRFPFVNQFRIGSGSFEHYKIISCTTKQVTETNLKNGFITSRRYFDEQILNMALDRGAKLIKEKIVDIQKKQGHWEIRTPDRSLSARILIGADGVNSSVRRRIIGPIPKENLLLSYGYISTGGEIGHPIMRFLAGILGYAWIFPREGYSSIGVASELQYGSRLEELLNDFIRSYCPSTKIVSKFAALIPSAISPEFFALPCAGEDWILLGDAAGHADPISGGGILYALWGGKLAADAIKKNDLKLYDRLWREEYGKTLIERSKQRKTFYDPFTIELAIALEAYNLGLKKQFNLQNQANK
jgi:geranylgeranyl reductase family protein